MVEVTDTVQHQADSVAQFAPPDTIGRMNTPSLVGSYDRALSGDRWISKSSFNWLDHQYLGDILRAHPGIYLREQNRTGQYSQVNVRGQDWRSVAITIDGRPADDPAFGVYNLYHFTTEYADRVEVITGPRAFLYGMNSSGGAINLVTKNYDSNRPFSKVNFSEGPYGYLYSDGTFSQNVSRRLNLTFGFQHQETDGRFINSAHNAWNARAKLRFSLSKDLTLIFSGVHTTTVTQLNGGIDLESSGGVASFNRLLAIVENPDAFEKVTRNDGNLSFVGTFLSDSTNVTMLTLYYSHFLREYRDEENRSTPNGIFIHSDHRSSWMGISANQSIHDNFQRATIGAGIELRQIEGSPNLGRRRNVLGHAFLQEEILFDGFVLGGFARYDRYLQEDHVGYGTDISLPLNQFTLFGGVSRSVRVPTYQELFWNDSLVTRSHPILHERHLTMEAGIRFDQGSLGSVRAAYFHRTINDAIVIRSEESEIQTVRIGNVDRVSINGVEVSLALRFWVLALEGRGIYLFRTVDGSKDLLYPTLSGEGSLAFWKKLLQEKLELKLGVKGSYTSSQEGAAFHPEMIVYGERNGSRIGQGSVVDFFAMAHIGSAYIHLLWENPFDLRYYTTPYHPIYDRSIRLRISWEFLH
jgi:vitamin B12 transporter